MTSTKDNLLRAVCDLNVHLPLERELCPFDLAPVTSTAIQMVFGDTVAIALMGARNLTRDEYAANHPAGRIGKSLIFKVRFKWVFDLIRNLHSFSHSWVIFCCNVGCVLGEFRFFFRVSNNLISFLCCRIVTLFCFHGELTVGDVLLVS